MMVSSLATKINIYDGKEQNTYQGSTKKIKELSIKIKLN